MIYEIVVEKVCAVVLPDAVLHVLTLRAGLGVQKVHPSKVEVSSTGDMCHSARRAAVNELFRA